ncbi:MAG: LL-diaminopimelate aminotransferase [Phycisphaerae bacterium]|nr:LL-diaminopimelate aminotransferase [Phycisphaerae bacterium]
MFINEHFLKLSAGYLFPEIARRVSVFAQENPALAPRIIRCGIGDVTEPLPPAAIAALHAAVDELGTRERFRGYGPATGYDEVRRAIAEGDYRSRGVEIADDEIFLSDGSKPDASAFLEIVGAGNRIGVPDPVYPVYVDTNVMAGNTGAADDRGAYAGLVPLVGTPANGFVAEPPAEPLDLVYLCFPNNPTGAVISREALERWVAWANRHRAVILYDAAYEAFIRDGKAPRSIFEIPEARRCAVEFRSFSKNGGFTGLRAGCTVVPRSLEGRTRDGRTVPLHGLWNRRWSTCSNGVSYPVQRAVEALYSPQGKREVAALIEHYMGNAAILRRALEGAGFRTWGGIDAPYVWVACPEGVPSWDLFDRLLRETQVVVTPGAGFGRHGEGFFRVSAFNSRSNAEEAATRLATFVVGTPRTSRRSPLGSTSA